MYHDKTSPKANLYVQKNNLKSTRVFKVLLVLPYQIIETTTQYIHLAKFLNGHLAF